ncbi:luciferase family oxidoreductase group 1 [Deinobacterium chartae]|uniref:Luciferase family oxidoreductase group 1 n=1 Tax=Deinobacterium chartae TaxID=521158 RepID=A0A841I2M5_9DEIO|nr:MsnO8 family LLM class oxidoreductase [Deinobacterium chartae]MBB6098598.1 luciferase family oxidoreductase group 1 [Deinobacterium chartae]
MSERRELRLSVLDVMPCTRSGARPQAVQETLALARLADDCGYARYWLAEHHGTDAVASSAPEIMVAAVAQTTRYMRVGSGGILLGRYDPHKVAEVFETLGALYGDRIDLGIARGRGGPAVSGDEFSSRLERLVALLEQRRVNVQLWLLGNGVTSRDHAVRLGARFAYGDPAAGPKVLEEYRQRFVASPGCPEAQDLLCVTVVCAELARDAEELAWSAVQFGHDFGAQFGRVLAPSLARQVLGYFPEERLGVQYPRLIHGDPAGVRRDLLRLREVFGVRELMVSTVIHDAHLRRTSYALIAEALAPYTLTRLGLRSVGNTHSSFAGGIR